MSKKTQIIPISNIKNRIFSIRGVQVIIDSDLAELYGVENKRLNEQVKRNNERFPEEFRFQLTKEEFEKYKKVLRSQFATSKDNRGGRQYLPYVFTEQGISMLSAVLHSITAIIVSIKIKEFGKGFSVDNLENMRRFYLVYQKPETVSRNFKLSWSHYIFLTRVTNPDERNFYEIEAVENSWSLRELKRQFNTGLYEKLAISCDKFKVKELSTKGHIIQSVQDLIKDPYNFFPMEINKQLSQILR